MIKCPIHGYAVSTAYHHYACRCIICVTEHKRNVHEWYTKNHERLLAKRKIYVCENRNRMNESRRKNYHRQKSSIKNSHLQRLYGITIDQYCEMETKQNFLCAICRKQNTSGRLAVDHNHQTGKVRQLLCHPCNLAVGFYENFSLKNKIEYYLKQNSETN